MWMHGGGPGARHRVFTGAVEALMKDLPDAKREHAGELLKSHRSRVSQLRKQLRQHRRTAKDAILTDPYDEAKVADTLARFRELRTGQHQSMHTMMMGLMKDLTLKEREQLLNHIRAGFRHRWGHHRHPNGPRSGDRPSERQ
jgi:uncharacterized membrane protein